VVLGGGLKARAVVASIVEVGTAANRVGREVGQKRFDPGIKLALTEVTAAAVVADVVRVGELVGRHDDVPNADVLGQASGVVHLRPRDARTVGRHGNGPVAEGLPRRVGDDRAVDAAAEGDRNRAHAAQRL